MKKRWVGRMGFSFFSIPDPYLAGITGGTLAGLAQSCVLWRQVSRPALWVPSTIVASTLGWVAGEFVCVWVYEWAGYHGTNFVAGAAGGAVIGAVSALPLLMMLRHPKPRQEAVLEATHV